jgi:hypothetical protein
VGVFWPAWVWIEHPESRWLFATYREPLAVRDSVKCRSLIESDWYQQRWGNRFQSGKIKTRSNGLKTTAPAIGWLCRCQPEQGSAVTMW